MEGQKVGLIYDLIVPDQLSLVVVRPFNPEHLLDHGTG
jgi:hypothetical protein